jgi:hypothetical protein
VIAGRTNGFGSGYQIILVKTDSMGVELWTNTYGQASIDAANCVIEYSVGNQLVIAGGGSSDFILIMTDSVGAEMWVGLYGGASADTAHSVIEHSIDNGLGVYVYVCVCMRCVCVCVSLQRVYMCEKCV